MTVPDHIFWLQAIASLAEVFAPLSVSEAEQALKLVLVYFALTYVTRQTWGDVPDHEVTVPDTM